MKEKQCCNKKIEFIDKIKTVTMNNNNMRRQVVKSWFIDSMLNLTETEARIYKNQNFATAAAAAIAMSYGSKKRHKFWNGNKWELYSQRMKRETTELRAKMEINCFSVSWLTLHLLTPNYPNLFQIYFKFTN